MLTNYRHLAFNLPLSHLYTNSLLSTLNARVIGSNNSGRFNDCSDDQDFVRGIAVNRKRKASAVDVELSGGMHDSVRNAQIPAVCVSLTSMNQAKFPMNSTGSQHQELGVGNTKVFIDIEEVSTVSP
jgi:hypothetical protein